MRIDNDLDRVAIYISKLTPNDQYREALEKESNLYRELLEAFPADAILPEELTSSIYSLLQRIKNYIVHGSISNPLLPIVPSMSKSALSVEDKERILQTININPSFLANKRQKLEINTQFLESIDYKNSDIKDIASAIEIATLEYEKSNIYSNDYEQEVAKAKYFYMLRLVQDNAIDEANELLQSFDTDVLLYIHLRYKNVVQELLSQNKAYLANEMYHFLNEFQDNKINDIDFWKILLQIEYPDCEIKEEKKEVETAEVETAEDEDIKENKLNIFSRLFSSKNKISGKCFSCIAEPHDFLKIYLKLFPGYELVKSEYIKLIKYLRSLKRKWRYFNNIFVYTERYKKVHSFDLSDAVLLSTVIQEISKIFDNKISLDMSKDTEDRVISKELFRECKLKSVFLPPFIERIEECAFKDCFGLQEVEFGSFIKNIGDEAFRNCGLIKVDLSKANLYEDGIGKYCFYDNEKLKEVILHSDLKVIKDHAFCGCSSLTSISLENISEVEKSAFAFCTNLEKIEKTQDLIKIGQEAFRGCRRLKDFQFTTMYSEEGLVIEDYAFKESGLKKLYLDAFTLTIGEGVFEDCELRYAKIYSDIASLPAFLFANNRFLEEVRLPINLMSIEESCFERCGSLKMIRLPITLERISRNAFKGCVNLEEIIFNGTLNYLADDAFAYCEVKL